MPVLIDTNVIFDIVNQDPTWFQWSYQALETNAHLGFIANEMIYTELCCSAQSSDEVDALLKSMRINLVEIPREALFLAAKAHLLYRKRGGTRTAALPDFFIGAHAQTLQIPLLTRDKGRYHSYFSKLKFLVP